MKKILFIIILFLSCEEELGVEEFSESFTYYDYLAYGWAKIFENDLELALHYFDEALNTEVDYYNSAIVGMGWAVTYTANNLLNSETCINNSDDCTSVVDEDRNKAKCYYYRSTLTDEDLSLLNSDQILEWCDQDDVDINTLYGNIDIMNISLTDAVSYYTNACMEDENGNIEFINCFENFLFDLQVGHIYLEYISYVQSILDDSIIDQSIDDIILLFDTFYQSNSTYDIMDDKSNYDFSYDFNYKNIAATISQLYLDNGQYELSCQYAQDICDDLECSGNPLEVIDCIETNL